MSVRSFDKIVNSPDPEKLSVILQRVRDLMANNLRHCFICLTAYHVYDDDVLATDELVDATQERVASFLEANGVGPAGDWFSAIYGECRPLWEDGGHPPHNGAAVAERTARLAVLDVLIHQLRQRGE